MTRKEKRIHKIEKFDYLTGLIRGWGIVLYSALPASLSMLNLLEIKVTKNTFRIEYLIIAILPLSVLFLLILNRQRAWYLEKSFLFIRTSISLLIILLISTSICGLSLLVKDNYIVTFSISGIKGIIEAFLMSISSLVLSAALFLAVLIKNDNLPGVPNLKMVSYFDSVREKLIKIQKNEIWNDANNFTKSFLEITYDLKKELNNYDIILEPRTVKYESKSLLSDVSKLIELLERLNDTNSPEKELIIGNELNNFQKKDNSSGEYYKSLKNIYYKNVE